MLKHGLHLSSWFDSAVTEAIMVAATKLEKNFIYWCYSLVWIGLVRFGLVWFVYILPYLYIAGLTICHGNEKRYHLVFIDVTLQSHKTRAWALTVVSYLSHWFFLLLELSTETLELIRSVVKCPLPIKTKWNRICINYTCCYGLESSLSETKQDDSLAWIGILLECSSRFGLGFWFISPMILLFGLGWKNNIKSFYLYCDSPANNDHNCIFQLYLD